MGVIRHGGTVTTAPFSFSDIEASAERILDEARAEAQRIVAAAEREAESVARIRGEKAHAEGMREGRKAGEQRALEEARAAAIEKARADVASTSAAIVRSFVAFEDARRRLLAEAESGILSVAIAVARRVCHLHAAQTPDAAIQVVRACLELIRHEGDVEVRLHPCDVEQMREIAPHLAAALDGINHISVVDDADLKRGDCLLRTRHGEIDARIDTQVDRIAAALLGPPLEDATEDAS